MKSKLMFFVLVVTTACAAPLGSTIELTPSERAQSVKIAEHRQDLSFRMQQLQAKFQADSNRLNEENQQINIESNVLCFAFKKTHKLDPGVSYRLDEWKGELIKQ